MDDALRELERRWRSTGAPADEQAWLRARVRAGKLDPWRLELAARCGHPGLGGPEAPPLRFAEWLIRLPFQGKRGGLRREWTRALLALARALEPVGIALGRGDWVSPALDLAELSYLGQLHEPEVLRAARQRLSALAYELHPYSWETPSPAAALISLTLAPLERALDPRTPGHDAGAIAELARHALEPEGVWGVEPGVDALIEARFPRAAGRLWGLRQVIAHELIAWALDQGDPLQARAAGR